MKKLILPLLIVIAFSACTKKNTVTISGNIDNPLAENATVKVNGQTDTIPLADDGTFSTVIEIEKENLVYFRNGGLRLSLYLIPGTEINIDLDIDDFKNNTVSDSIYSGSGSEVTAFMFSLKKKSIKEGVRELIGMPVDTFKLKMDNAYSAVVGEIEKFETESKVSKECINIISMIQDINFAQKYMYYVQYHSRLVPGDTTAIPGTFQEFIDKIPVKEYDKYKHIAEFKSFSLMVYDIKINKELEADTSLTRGSVAYANKNTDLITSLEISQDLKDELGNNLLSSYSYAPDSVREVYKARYKELVQKEEYVEGFEKTIAAIEKTKPGEIAPSFNYSDINGNMVSSESLKGKVIYIDVWATWCGPCRGEIPHLKNLEEEFHGQPVAFVSISIDEDKSAWEKMVKDEELKGYQLFAEGAWKSDIVVNYAIKGIPRFIMVDKEGKIVNANATRPSNPATKEKLLELAKG